MGKNHTYRIYKIVNKINGKYYVGGSKFVHRRWCLHIKDLNWFCKNNGLLIGHLSSIYSVKRTHHKGWTKWH